MPRKAIFNQEDIIEAGFEFARRYGIQSLSARKLADELHASTAPVYSYIGSIEAVRHQILDRAEELLFEYIKIGYSEEAALNFQVGIIRFARDETNLFKALFIQQENPQRLIEECGAKLAEELEKDTSVHDFAGEALKDYAENRWIFTFGIALMVQTGSFDASDERTVIDKLKSFGNSRAIQSPGEQLSMGF